MTPIDDGCEINVTTTREARTMAGTWNGGMDFLSRKPFQYQPLCYQEAHDVHAAAGTPTIPAPALGVQGPVVKVAVLQVRVEEFNVFLPRELSTLKLFVLPLVWNCR